MAYPVRTHRWTRAAYDRLIEVGVFQPGDPVELLGGELVVAEPQSSPHYTAICLVEEALRASFGTGWVIRTQGPIALDDESEPEPDIAVAQGGVRDYSREHPAHPVGERATDESTRLRQPRLGGWGARARPVRSELAATGEPCRRGRPHARPPPAPIRRAPGRS
jgi:hypothetical protein